jgi:uncharacterized protein YdeI (YjbR/CyaY-like superfamily)
MELYKYIKTFYAKDRKAWRKWLSKNHSLERSVWLIIFKKESATPSVYYPEAVDEALCFGWIDSKPNKRDANSYYQFFSQRNPKSRWSKVNKEKVARLIEQGMMQDAGYRLIEIAKKNGSWTSLEDVDNIILPADLKLHFSKNKVAFENWEKFPRSSRRGILEWILSAKKPETRLNRIQQTVELASKNLKANHYRQ